MKTKWFQKIFVISLVVALTAAFLPGQSVFAAGGDASDIDNLEQEWSNKVSYVRMQNLFYTQARLFPADFQDPADMARAYELLHKYGFALKQANAIILEHAGFDETGDVIDAEEAVESAQELAMYLHVMRGMRTKIDEEGYKVHLLR
jgi:hypothetical protein